MGGCSSKSPRPVKPNPYAFRPETPTPSQQFTTESPAEEGKKSVTQIQAPISPFYSRSPARFGKKSVKSPRPVSGNSTPRKFLRRPPSPTKHIKAVLARRQGTVKPNNNGGVAREENGEGDLGLELDKSFGFSNHLTSKYEIGEEVGRGHFGYTCSATAKKGDIKGQKVAVKFIPKAKMTTSIAIEDVRREVKILRALSGQSNLVKFYDAFEDQDNVYIVMELCEGGELLDRILARNGKYTEDEANTVLVQMLNFVAYCHLQGVVHRDLKPENFMYTTKDENSPLKAIDFGLSDFVRPDEKLNDIVGSAYYVAPEVLLKSYSTEADVWSIGVIAYILLCGGRPFWARTESGIFRAVLKAEPNFSESLWPNISSEAKDFVKRILNKDPRKRLSAAQALSHPWMRNHNDVKVPLDILVFKLMKLYMQSSPLRKAALRSLSKTLNTDDIFYLKEQFNLLGPKNGSITLETIRAALARYETDAMKEARIPEMLNSLNALDYRRMDFEEFCAAATSVHQLEAREGWEQTARSAFEFFEKDGNRAMVIDELESELGLGRSVPLQTVLHDWIRHPDGNLSFLGFVKLLHGLSTRPATRSSTPKPYSPRPR